MARAQQTHFRKETSKACLWAMKKMIEMMPVSSPAGNTKYMYIHKKTHNPNKHKSTHPHIPVNPQKHASSSDAPSQSLLSFQSAPCKA
jgi:hypothetical protein